MVKDATSSNRELVELSGQELAEINLHAVESISDLHSASKASGGMKLPASSSGLQHPQE